MTKEYVAEGTAFDQLNGAQQSFIVEGLTRNYGTVMNFRIEKVSNDVAYIVCDRPYNNETVYGEARAFAEGVIYTLNNWM